MLRALAAIWLIWGLNWVVMKTANTYFPPILFVTWRFGSGALILLAVAYWKKIPLPDAKFLPWIILTGILQLNLNNIAAQVGMQTISAGMAAVLNYTAPLWTAILAHFALNEKLTRIKFFGLFLAMLGLYVLMGLQRGVHNHFGRNGYGGIKYRRQTQADQMRYGSADDVANGFRRDKSCNLFVAIPARRNKLVRAGGALRDL